MGNDRDSRELQKLQGIMGNSRELKELKGTMENGRESKKLQGIMGDSRESKELQGMVKVLLLRLNHPFSGPAAGGIEYIIVRARCDGSPGSVASVPAQNSTIPSQGLRSGQQGVYRNNDRGKNDAAGRGAIWNGSRKAWTASGCGTRT